MIGLLFLGLASCKMIEEFYYSTRALMKNDVLCLAFLGISSFFILFLSRRNIYISVLPLVGLIIKFTTVAAIREINILLPDLRGITATIALNAIEVLKYMNKDAVRFLVSSLVCAYVLIGLCNIIVFLIPTISLIFLYDFYISKISADSDFQIFLLNTLLFLLCLVIYLTIKKIQKVSLTLLCCFYSSIILLNSLEIYFILDLGMKNLFLTDFFFEKGNFLTFVLTFLGFISQYPLYKREKKHLEVKVKDLELENKLIKDKLERLYMDAKIKNMSDTSLDFHDKLTDGNSEVET